MRVLIATCTVDYSGRLSAHLDPATRVIMAKADGSILIHSDGGSYKPLNWMNAPCTVTVEVPESDEEVDGVTEVWTVQADKKDDRLVISIHDIVSDVNVDLGEDPGLVKDGAAGVVYVVATYGEQIVAWAKKVLASLPKCPCCKEEPKAVEETAAEEAPAEEPAEEVPAEAPAEEVPTEEPAAEVTVNANEPVAEEADFAE